MVSYQIATNDYEQVPAAWFEGFAGDVTYGLGLRRRGRVFWCATSTKRPPLVRLADGTWLTGTSINRTAARSCLSITCVP